MLDWGRRCCGGTGAAAAGPPEGRGGAACVGRAAAGRGTGRRVARKWPPAPGGAPSVCRAVGPGWPRARAQPART
eukprot:4444944-Alexandrium_andersonii.AAC.1